MERLKEHFKGGPALTPRDFLLSNPMSQEQIDEILTVCHKTFAQGYRNMFSEQKVTLCDLQQNPKQRPRWGSCHFPTLTTGCSRIFNVEVEQIYSGGLMSERI